MNSSVLNNRFIIIFFSTTFIFPVLISYFYRENLKEVKSNDKIILIPGLLASKLEVKLNRTNGVNNFCNLNSDWHDLWFNIYSIAPKFRDCFQENMMLYYNKETKLNENAPGTEIRVKDFGLTSSVDYLFYIKHSLVGYFGGLIKTLEKKNNLTRNLDIISAGYDFRKAPNELNEYYNNLTKLIENHYLINNNNNNKLTIICHSLGCLNTFYFLNSKEQIWKDTYLKRIITLNAPWDGSIQSIMKIFVSFTKDWHSLFGDVVNKIALTLPSLLFLFPNLNEDRILIETKNFNYSVKNLDLLFKSKNLLNQLEIWHETHKIAKNIRAPNVELYCLYSYGLRTQYKLIFDDDNLNGNYRIIYDDGDATVDINSLKYCEHFSKQQDKPVIVKSFKGYSHANLIRSYRLRNYISTILK